MEIIEFAAVLILIAVVWFLGSIPEKTIEEEAEEWND